MSIFLYKLIDEGEHQQQDFKYCINDSKKIAKSLVAFANTDDSRFLISVKDNGKIIGIKSDEEFYMVEAAAKIYSKPSITFLTKQWQIGEKIVLEIQIKPSNKKPHFAKNGNRNWLAYIRCANENILAHKIEIWNKQNSSQGIYFSFSDDEKCLINYLKRNSSISSSKFIRLAHTSRKKAMEILSNIVIMNVITINSLKEETTFSLTTNIQKTEFRRFQ